MELIGVFDLVVFAILFALVHFFTNKFIKANSKDILIQKFFRKGLYLKIGGSLAFGLFHYYIVQGGDTFGYFTMGVDILKQFMSSPANYLRLIFAPFDSIADLRLSIPWRFGDDIMWLGDSNYFPCRVVGLLGVFGLGTYYGTGLVFAIGSYWGIWKAFRIFCRLYPPYTSAIAWAFLYFPTVIFWGSGISKDTIALGAICGFTYLAYNIFLFGKWKPSLIIFMFLLGYLVFSVKAYIIFAFLPPLLFAILLKRIVSLKNKALKILLIPSSLLVLSIVMYFALSYIGNNFTKFNPEVLKTFIVNTNVNLQAANSAFDLGIKPENINSTGDLLAFFPKAVVASWFRPWLWETKSPAMLLSAIESIIILYLFVYIMIKGYIFKTLGIIIKDPVLFSSIIYAIIFCGLVGLSTSNFGTLVRYKLPAMPFLGITLLLVYIKLREKEKK